MDTQTHTHTELLPELLVGAKNYLENEDYWFVLPRPLLITSERLDDSIVLEFYGYGELSVTVSLGDRMLLCSWRENKIRKIYQICLHIG